MSIDNRDGQIHEIYREGGGFTCPMKPMSLLHVVFKVIPEFFIIGGTGVWDPYAYYIINEAAVEAKIGCPPLEESIFKKAKEYCGPKLGRGDPHVCSSLFPVGISKCDDVIFEDDVNCFN